MQNFHKQARSYIQKLINQRYYLMKIGKNQKSGVIHSADYLKKYLTWYRYDNNQQMAKFFLDNAGRIHHLIPGGLSPQHATQISRFNELKNKATIILNQS